MMVRRAMTLPLVVCALAGCDIQVGERGVSVDVAGGRATDEWVRTYTLPENGELEIVSVNGAIEATPATGSQIEVRVERTVRADSEETARLLLGQLDMGEHVTGNRVKIEASERTDGRNGFGRRPKVELRYHVQVPAGLNVTFRTSNGGVRLEGLNARIVASTINGGITGERLSGGARVTAVNGGIRIDMASVTTDVEVSTTNGGIRLDLPTDVKATLEADCVNGGIGVDDGLKLQAHETSRRHVAGTLNGGGPRIVVTTVNGGIRVQARGT